MRATGERRYARTHPRSPSRSTSTSWRTRPGLLGEAESKCEQVAGAPAAPGDGGPAYKIYLSKGIRGTTAIEGNTLSEEEEALQRVTEGLDLPPSRDYLGREVDNILAAMNEIVADVAERRRLPLTPERIARFNEQVLKGFDLDEGVVPGQVRLDEVDVPAIERFLTRIREQTW